ncbi:MAG: hypothetical protein RLZZ451_814, partial [Pseudomonadota bacterium]
TGEPPPPLGAEGDAGLGTGRTKTSSRF